MSFILNPYAFGSGGGGGGGPPAFVGGTSGNFINGGGGSISLTSLSGGLASAPAEDDIVIVCLGLGTQSLRNVSCSFGTLIATLSSDDSFDSVFHARYKIMTSSPDTSISVTGTGNVTDSLGYAVHVWRNIDTTTPLDVAATTATDINGAVPNPPSITPVTAGAIIVAMGGAGGGTLSNLTNPGSVTNFFQGWGADTQDGTAGIYSYESWTSGAYDPPAFGGGGGGGTSAWCACTIALRPA
jgi:hypothetical protein